MMYVITGGSGSGKSEYAENLAVSLSGGESPLLYIATMYPYGQEGRKRIARHRRLRAGKGFETRECYTDLSLVMVEKEATVLLECMSNYVANKMFPEERMEKTEEQELVALVTEEIAALKNKAKHLLLVTNEIFAEGSCYEEETLCYLRNLGAVNTAISQMADQVTEVVAGIPLSVKGENLCCMPW